MQHLAAGHWHCDAEQVCDFQRVEGQVDRRQDDASHEDADEPGEDGAEQVRAIKTIPAKIPQLLLDSHSSPFALAIIFHYRSSLLRF